MAFTEQNQPTRRRGRSRTVTKAETQAAWDRVRTAADAGDIQASALLIALVENKPIMPVGQTA